MAENEDWRINEYSNPRKSPFIVTTKLLLFFAILTLAQPLLVGSKRTPEHIPDAADRAAVASPLAPADAERTGLVVWSRRPPLVSMCVCV